MCASQKIYIAAKKLYNKSYDESREVGEVSRVLPIGILELCGFDNFVKADNLYFQLTVDMCIMV